MQVERTVLDGVLTAFCDSALEVDVLPGPEPLPVPGVRTRLTLLGQIPVAGAGTGGRLRLVARSDVRRRLTLVVALPWGRSVLDPDPATGEWLLDVEPQQWLVLMVVDHAPGTATELVLAALDERELRSLPTSGALPPDEATAPDEALAPPPPGPPPAAPPPPAPPVTRSLPRSEPPVEPPPSVGPSVERSMRPRSDDLAPGWEWPSGLQPVPEEARSSTRPPPAAPEAAPEAAREAAPEPATLTFAEVGASMPAAVRIEEPVDVAVRLSRGEVRVERGRSHDEQVIVMDPARPVSITLLRRGLELAVTDGVAETGVRELVLPPPGAPDAELVFHLRAATLGEAEVQVVVRQDEAQPLATLRLTTRVLPAGADLEAELLAHPAEAATVVAPGVHPFLAPKTLVIDENLVGSVSELAFELVLYGVRRRFEAITVDKGPLLHAVFSALDEAWTTHRLIQDRHERHLAFQRSLRVLGARLAQEALPSDLVLFLRHNLTDLDELTIVTSGETDIPWELVHVWGDPAAPDAVEDPEGRGFLGRAGLVRWVYNTPHPTELRVRSGAAKHLVPAYRDSALLLSNTARELEYLAPFKATGVRPADAEGLARLVREGKVDLLHFAGHGRADDTCDPPIREMLLAGARSLDAPHLSAAERAKAAFGLEDLRRAFEERAAPSGDAPGPLVVLNACRIGQAPSTRSEVGGFAESFLRGGAGAFVGCLWSVGDGPARSFVEAFYAELCRGSSMAHATIAARTAAREAGDLSWLAYTVYAHPDAVLVRGRSRTTSSPTSPSPQQRGQEMTESTESTRAAGPSPERLAALHPYLVNVPDGRLAEGSSAVPTSIDDLRTTKADVDAIFETYLPAFLAGRERPVPMMIWAHGGLVGKESGIGIADVQVQWWKDNGVFPVHFVWETGLAGSLWDAVRDSLPGRSRGMLDEAKDKAIEVVVRAVPASAPTWGAMKRTAALASEPRTGGAWYFAQRLGEFVRENPHAITVHTAGHSAGSIFMAHLIPAILDAGVPAIASLNLLAPAIRVDDFKKQVMKPAVLDRIERVALFTMSTAFEKKDTCIGVYGKSLLYLIRASLEKEPRAEILGLQECVRRDEDLMRLFGAPGSGSKGEVMWSRTVGAAPFASTTSTSHGGFDNNPATMNSLAQRVTGRATLPSDFPSRSARAVGDRLWPSEAEAYDYIESRQAAGTSAGVGGRKRALCIGIDAYASPYQLKGCVADAKAWKAAFEQHGFDVELLTNKQATRERMVEEIKDLVVSSRPGDVIALQYSGHGTTVEDFSGDEKPEFDGDSVLVDEALCPVDFTAGNLLIDDDLGEIWDLLPEGVGLSIFFDSCHSGGSQRALTTTVPKARDRRARIVVLSSRAAAAYRRKRGSQRKARAAGDNNERAAFFAACQPDEVAWESEGHGDFTKRALPVLGSMVEGMTGQQFYDAVLTAFGPTRKQTPVIRPAHLTSRPLLQPLEADRPTGAAGAGQAAGKALGQAEGAIEQRAETVAGVVVDSSHRPFVPAQGGSPERRNEAAAQILRGLADLLET